MNEEVLTSKRFISNFFSVIVVSAVVIYLLGITFYTIIWPVLGLAFMLQIFYAICNIKVKRLSSFMLLFVAIELIGYSYITVVLLGGNKDGMQTTMSCFLLIFLTPILTVVFLEYRLVEYVNYKKMEKMNTINAVYKKNKKIVLYGFWISVISFSYPLSSLLYGGDSYSICDTIPPMIALLFMLFVCGSIYYLNGQKINSFSLLLVVTCIVLDIFAISGLGMPWILPAGELEGLLIFVPIPILIIVLANYLEIEKENCQEKYDYGKRNILEILCKGYPVIVGLFLLIPCFEWVLLYAVSCRESFYYELFFISSENVAMRLLYLLVISILFITSALYGVYCFCKAKGKFGTFYVSLVNIIIWFLLGINVIYNYMYFEVTSIFNLILITLVFNIPIIAMLVIFLLAKRMCPVISETVCRDNVLVSHKMLPLSEWETNYKEWKTDGLSTLDQEKKSETRMETDF